MRAIFSSESAARVVRRKGCLSTTGTHGNISENYGIAYTSAQGSLKCWLHSPTCEVLVFSTAIDRMHFLDLQRG